jgi:hypothetical protein
MDDNELHAQIAAAQTLAVAKLQERWGMNNEQVAKIQQGIAPSKQSEPHTITTADLEAAWGRSADSQLKSLGITPLTDAEDAAIKEAQERAVAEKQAARAAEMDAQLHDFRREVEHNRATKSGLYYSEDASKMREVERLVRETEANMILSRLEAGLSAEPAPRKSPAEIAQERYEARRKAQG